MKNKYFGTDGIRGTVNKGNITGEKFFKFGLASGTYFKNRKKSKQIAIIAKDTRLSGYTLDFKTKKEVKKVDDNLELSKEVEFDDNEFNEMLESDPNEEEE